MALTMIFGAVSLVESFVVPQPGAVFRSTQLGVLADPPSQGSELLFEEDDFSFEQQEEALQEVSSSATTVGQPIRRLRRDKKEPLIAVVGRPNVVRTIVFLVYYDARASCL